MSGPIDPRERIHTLDVLRGVAVLGILVMNIQSFALLDAAYSNPTLSGQFVGSDYTIWFWSHVLFDQKFLTIFSALFGAGIVLMCLHREREGASCTPVHYRRVAWLAVFGILHAYLLWGGDILYAYGITGMWVYLFRRARPSRLIAGGVGLVAVGAAITLVMQWSMPHWPRPWLETFIAHAWQPSPEMIDQEMAAFTGPYWHQVTFRAPGVLMTQTFAYVLWGAWRVGGVMLLGMAAWKLGVLDGGRSWRFYATMVLVAVLAGLPLVLWGVHQNQAHAWSADYSMLGGQLYNYWGSILVAGGWIGAVLLACRVPFLHGPRQPLAAVGRMAFTNYVMQTVVCTFIFYGQGLGWYGQLDRGRQLLVVFDVWVFQLLLSPVWLRYFRFGPLEWLWRSLTYGKVQPFRAERTEA